MNQRIVDEHRVLFDKMNAIVARNEIGELIVVRSRRTIKPIIPFIISISVFQEWKARDNKVVIADLPFEQLNTGIPFNFKIREDELLIVIQSFDELEFLEE
jgi:hypothetical protein